MVKTSLDFLTTPSNLFFALAAIALVALLARWRRSALICLTLSLGGSGAFGFTSLSEVIIAPLVTRFPPVDLAQVDPPFGLIVLGSGLNEVHAAHNGALLELEDGGEAIPTAALLAQRYPEAKIILSGGNGTNFPPEPLRATDGMRRIMIEFGIAEKRILIDPNSASTKARVSNTLALVGADREKPWWVLTPAHRMPRLIGAYRKEGFHPTAYPIDFKWIPPFDPTYGYALLDGLSLTDAGVHEWRGLLAYYLLGHIDTLFPAP